MTVSSIGSVAEFVTNGVTTNYPFYFKFLANEDLVVTYVDPLGVSAVLTLGTQYTVNGAGNDQGGSVITTTALAGPGQLVVSREMDTFQQTSLRNQGKFLAETHEDVFDRLTMLIQQGFAILSRALTRPLGRDYFFAENRRIANVKDPVDAQDAATKKSVESFVAGILQTGQGPINNAANVVYVDPAGNVTVVQALSGSQGSSFVGHVAAGVSTTPRTIQGKLRDIIARADYTTDAAFNAAKVGRLSIDGANNVDATVKPEDGSSPVTISRFFREESTNGPRDMLVWAGPLSVVLSGDDWAMGGFRRFGKYAKSRAPVFKAPSFQNTMTLPGSLAHGMTASTLSNWYATFAVANNADATASFKIAPFLFVKSVAGSVCTLGKCGEITNVNVIDAATYTWANNALAGTDVLVINEIFLSGMPSWTMRVAKITANTATTVTLDTIGSVGPKCFLLPAPAGWDNYRYCASFYLDTAEVRNMFDGSAGPTRCRMAGTNVVFAHGNDGTNSTYLDGAVAAGSKKIDLSRFIPPLATGVYLQSGYMLGTSSFPLRTDMFFDMDGGIHTPEVHTFQKDGANMNAIPLTVFLTFKGGQYYFPSTAGDTSTLARVNQNVTGWFEP